jgi:conjugative transfer region lipoprotein (TIGR03751 family)
MGNSIKFITAVLGVLLLVSACGTPPHKRLRQGTGPTMEQILQGDTEGASDRKQIDHAMQEHLLASENAAQRLYPRYENYTRDALNEINQLFPRHRNPRITLYVHPHLASNDNAPVPGYTTAFNLYASDEYALPSEVPPAYLPKQAPKQRVEDPEFKAYEY